MCDDLAVTTTDRPPAPAALPAPELLSGVEDPWTWPNRISLVRTALALAVAAYASTHSSLRLLAVAYAVYWVGDLLDGQVARRTHTETRQGAVLDIICDRASCGMLAVTYLALEPAAAPAITVYLLQFMVVDTMLSLGFLKWPVLSPNYFWQVDERIYRWNWSHPAKAVNTGALILTVTVGWFHVALVLALAQLAVKLVSLVALLRLPPPR